MRAIAPRFADLFSGAGLLGYGFAKAGCRPVYACDLDSDAISSYVRHVSPDAEVRSVTSIKTDIRCEILLAGAPCQGFSTLGPRNPRDERNRLCLSIADWAVITRARIIVVENVPPFLESSHWKQLRCRLVALGYETTEWLLDACDYGTPQRRIRAFAIASKVGLPQKPRRLRAPRKAGEILSNLPFAATDPLADVPRLGPIAAQRISLIPPGGDWRDIMR